MSKAPSYEEVKDALTSLLGSHTKNYIFSGIHHEVIGRKKSRQIVPYDILPYMRWCVDHISSELGKKFIIKRRRVGDYGIVQDWYAVFYVGDNPSDLDYMLADYPKILYRRGIYHLPKSKEVARHLKDRTFVMFRDKLHTFTQSPNHFLLKEYPKGDIQAILQATVQR